MPPLPPVTPDRSSIRDSRSSSRSSHARPTLSPRIEERVHMKITRCLAQSLTLGQAQHGERKTSKSLEHKSHEHRARCAIALLSIRIRRTPLHLASPRPTNNRESINASSPKPSGQARAPCILKHRQLIKPKHYTRTFNPKHVNFTEPNPSTSNAPSSVG